MESMGYRRPPNFNGSQYPQGVGETISPRNGRIATQSSQIGAEKTSVGTDGENELPAFVYMFWLGLLTHGADPAKEGGQR